LAPSKAPPNHQRKRENSTGARTRFHRKISPIGLIYRPQNSSVLFEKVLAPVPVAAGGQLAGGLAGAPAAQSRPSNKSNKNVRFGEEADI
jgi:hypothetical protein